MSRVHRRRLQAQRLLPLGTGHSQRTAEGDCLTPGRGRILRYCLALLPGLYALAVLLAALRPSGSLPPHPYFAGSDFLVIAHRGGRALGPEHTLKTFRRAVDVGVDVLEMDVRLSADGALVLHHSRSIDRTTDGSGRVDSLTLAQLQALDAGYRWQDESRTYPFRGQGYRLATLAEVFEAFPDQRMLIEIKPSDPGVAVALCGSVRDAGMQDKVTVASFHTDIQSAFRAACPDVLTSPAVGDMIAYELCHLLRLDGLYAPDFELFQVPERVGSLTLVDERFITVARQRNLPVQVWTVNEEEDMERLIDLGVDGIVTDHPLRLLNILRRRGRR